MAFVVVFVSALSGDRGKADEKDEVVEDEVQGFIFSKLKYSFLISKHQNQKLYQVESCRALP